MQLRTVLFCSFLVVPALAACGDDSGGGGAGGDASTTGATVTSTTPASSGANNTTTGGEGGDPTGGSTSSAGGGDPELSCDTYCDTIMEACSDDIQYPDGDACRAACATFPEGTYADSDGSLGCHQYHADAATSDPVVHCVHAGPMGGGQCAEDPCTNFCEIAPVVCPDSYDSVQVGEKVCAGFADVGDYSVAPPATGDTLGCRMYHLMAAIDDPDTHCEHTEAVSTQCN